MSGIDHGSAVRAAIGKELLAARKARDTDRARVQRTLLAAIDNAGAVDAPQTYDATRVGVGSAEADRLRLDEPAVRRLFERERRERDDARAGYRDRGQDEAAAVLDAEVAVIDDYLDRLPDLVPSGPA